MLIIQIIFDTIPFEPCNGCETSTPSLDHECLICGQTTTLNVFRVTYCMEVYIDAENETEARTKFGNMDLKNAETGFVELISIESNN